MNRPLLIKCCILAAASLSCVPVAQAADDRGWYIGASGGRTDVKRASSWEQLADVARQANGVTGTTLASSSHDTAWKIFGGYQFNENVAVEGGYTDLGRYNGTTRITSPAAGTATVKWDAKSALNMSAVAILPFWQRLSAFGKAGLALTDLSVDLSAPAAGSLDATRVQLLLGLGLKLGIAKGFSLRAEFERFNNVGDGSNTGQSPINVWTLGAQYRF